MVKLTLICGMKATNYHGEQVRSGRPNARFPTWVSAATSRTGCRHSSDSSGTFHVLPTPHPNPATRQPILVIPIVLMPGTDQAPPLRPPSTHAPPNHSVQPVLALPLRLQRRSRRRPETGQPPVAVSGRDERERGGDGAANEEKEEHEGVGG